MTEQQHKELLAHHRGLVAKHRKFFWSLIAILIVVIGTAYAGLWHWRTQVAMEPVPTFTPGLTAPPAVTTYNNNQYGFLIPLLSTWNGYTVLNSEWQGIDVTGDANQGKVVERGPMITLRHPQWSEKNQREDMPVMVFTSAQWEMIKSEKIGVGAAPIAPSELGHNSKYVLALPARYNYDFRTGWQEVDQLVHMLKAFEPTQ